MGNITIKRRTLVHLLILIVTFIIGTCAVGVARYLTSTEKHVEMLSSDFHISADLLERRDMPVPTNTVADMRTCGLNFHIYNYQKENVALVSDEEIEYDIDAEGWNVTVWDGDNEILKNSSGHYIMPVDHNMHEYRVELTPTSNSKSSNKVRATVTTIRPYQIVMQGDFVVPNITIPSYKIDDFANYVQLTIYGNNYNGNVTVNWSTAFSPNNADTIMETWRDSNPTGTIQVSPNKVYDLIFYKNANISLHKTITEGSNIFIG